MLQAIFASGLFNCLLEGEEVITMSQQVVKENAPGPSPAPAQDLDNTYPTALTLFLIFLSLCTATFLVALDGTIIATAIPTITNEFNSLSDVSWYNSAFLLTTCAFQLPWGRAYTLFDTKWVFFAAVGVFEVGSVVCGATPNSVGLVVGRGVAGEFFNWFFFGVGGVTGLRCGGSGGKGCG